MRVLAAVDLGEGSDEVIRQAHAWARREDAALGVVHVVPDFTEGHAIPLGMIVERSSLAAMDLERRVTELIERRVRDITGRTDTEIFVDVGADHVRILARAEAFEADLVVVGSHGTGGLERIFGDVADKVVRNASAAVLVARTSPQGPILAATDFSPIADTAVAAAAREAKLRGAQLVVAHVVHAPGMGYISALGAALGAPPVTPPPDALAAQRTALKETIETTLARHDAKGETVILDGTPAVEIVRAAEHRHASLIVVATHGSAGWKRHITLGSVAERVIRSAPCSVLVTRVKP